MRVIPRSFAHSHHLSYPLGGFRPYRRLYSFTLSRSVVLCEAFNRANVSSPRLSRTSMGCVPRGMTRADFEPSPTPPYAALSADGSPKVYSHVSHLLSAGPGPCDDTQRLKALMCADHSPNDAAQQQRQDPPPPRRATSQPVQRQPLPQRHRLSADADTR